MTTVLDKAKALRELPSPSARRAIRVAAGLTEADIATAVGVHRATVARWELGERSPSAAHLHVYVALLRDLRSL